MNIIGKKTMKKKTAILIGALGMVLCFAGCGDSKDASDTSAPVASTSATEVRTEAPKGTTGTWGNYVEVLIPDGMKLTGGSQIDKDDPDSFWIQKTDNAIDYYLFGVSTEEQSKKDVASTKEFNKDRNPQDITLKTGDYDWTGVTYKYSDKDVVQMYAKIGDKVINVRIGGFAYDSDTTKAILASIKLK